MEEWANRPHELAYLLNPAFCALILRSSISGFFKESKKGMPYSLSFLILPIILHKTSREALPTSIATWHHAWIQKYQQVKINFPQRAKSLVAYTKEAHIYGLHDGYYRLIDDSRLSPTNKKLKHLPWDKYSEPAICMKKAEFLGRWLSTTGDVTTIFSAWGIRP